MISFLSYSYSNILPLQTPHAISGVLFCHCKHALIHFWSHDSDCIFNDSLTNYSRLVMYSFGSNQAFRRGFQQGDELYFTKVCTLRYMLTLVFDSSRFKVHGFGHERAEMRDRHTGSESSDPVPSCQLAQQQGTHRQPDRHPDTAEYLDDD